MQREFKPVLDGDRITYLGYRLYDRTKAAADLTSGF
jgi:hypothetical protein